ncbi:Uncharacterized protein sll0005 [Coccomyxa sp. Obi]|nr:Uncharacterized protein sll0005 [Coccomyxa sp. Obi]
MEVTASTSDRSAVCSGLLWTPRKCRAQQRRRGARSQRGRIVISNSYQASSLRSMSSQYADIRKQLESDEQLASLMAGLRGSNLNDSDYAEEGVTMSLVEVDVGDDEDDRLPLVYDPVKIADFWSTRPVAVATRIVQLLRIAGGFLSGFLWDLANGKLAETEVKRAIQLRNIVTSLGPAYIKLGQALSIRPDILSPAAMVELQKLCDKVPSYDNDVAMQVIQDELGAPWYEVYAELSPRPIAAASLGQVYKGKLKSGETVAVKVQRPGVLETVSIDLFVIRKIGIFLRRFPEIRTDVPALVDEWACRFFEELDYVNEGQNQIRFAESIKEDLPQVVVPKTYTEFTRRRVLTSQWIDGEKLSQSKADDVATLVNVGVVCYLKQLLDTGFFMADPHPGNLIRTPDARLAILDFGLMTSIDDNIKYGMIEAISHLIHRDYEAIVQDFVTLDFIPKGTDLSPILPVLARVFDQALEGGGAKNINFQELAADLAQITFDYPFRIPPYFALIIRAISVLEGIALVANPDFAIVDEAYPYVAKKLLTDQSPRLQAALQYMIYGKENTFNAVRLIDLLGAYETFREASQSARGTMEEADSLAGLPQTISTGLTASLPPGGGPTNHGSYRPMPAAWPRSNNGAELRPSSQIFPSPGGWPIPAASLIPAPALGLLSSAIAVPSLLLGSFLEANEFPDLASLARSPAAMDSPTTSTISLVAASSTGAREALKLLLSPEGKFFREFITNEVVLSIDAMSRTQLVSLVERLGLSGIQVPILLPGAARSWVPLTPHLTEEDKRAMDNVATIVEFLVGSRTDSSDTLQQIAPLLPEVAAQMLPEIVSRLTSRIAARTLRELYMLPS